MHMLYYSEYGCLQYSNRSVVFQVHVLMHKSISALMKSTVPLGSLLEIQKWPKTIPLWPPLIFPNLSSFSFRKPNSHGLYNGLRVGQIQLQLFFNQNRSDKQFGVICEMPLTNRDAYEMHREPLSKWTIWAQLVSLSLYQILLNLNEAF